MVCDFVISKLLPHSRLGYEVDDPFLFYFFWKAVGVLLPFYELFFIFVELYVVMYSTEEVVCYVVVIIYLAAIIQYGRGIILYDFIAA